MSWCAMCGNRNENKSLGDENYSAISSKIRRLEAENNELRGLLSRLKNLIEGPTRTTGWPAPPTKRAGLQTKGTTMIQLGQKAKDKVTGFEGIIIARCQYLTGCDQYGLVPPAKDGKIEPAQWFDAGRIEIVGPGVTEAEVTAPRNGGPNRDAPRV